MLTAVSFLSSQAGHAGTIVWDNVIHFNNVSGSYANSSTDVSNLGTTVLALQQLSTPGATINGVNFSNSTTQNGVTYSQTFGANPNTYNGFVSPGVIVDNTTASTAYRSLLLGGWYGDNGVQFSLSGLTVGQQYLVQVWSSDLRTGLAGARFGTLTMNGATNTNTPTLTWYNNATGSTVVGRFTADNATQGFTMDSTGSYSGNNAQINAIQVRAVPEPSATALLAMALVTAVAGRVRKRSWV